MISTAVIMAAGKGTRMRTADEAVPLTREQAAAAAVGAKGLMPIGRPFLEYVISALADAGITHVVIVTGPHPDPVHRHFSEAVSAERVSISFAVQPEALGTADAVVRAADSLSGASKGSTFLVLNSDNYYPIEAYTLLMNCDGAATVAFDRDSLVRDGNIDRERVRAFAVLDISEDGILRDIIEKPDASLDTSTDAGRWVGMNLWAVNSHVVDACRRVPLSVRGEYELPEAVRLAIADGEQVKAVRLGAPVLDLSRRSDVASVAERLGRIDPRI